MTRRQVRFWIAFVWIWMLGCWGLIWGLVPMPDLGRQVGLWFGLPLTVLYAALATWAVHSWRE